MKNMNQLYTIIYFRKFPTFFVTWLAMQVYSLFSYCLEIASLFMPISLGSVQTFGYLNAYSNSFFISIILLIWCLNHNCNSGRYPQKLSCHWYQNFIFAGMSFVIMMLIWSFGEKAWIITHPSFLVIYFSSFIAFWLACWFLNFFLSFSSLFFNSYMFQSPSN